MVPPIYRAAAHAWLSCFELFLAPLRALAAPAPMSAADQRALQEEAWSELAERLRGGPITEPIFTDAVVARAKAR